MPDPYRDQSASRRRPSSFGRRALRALLWTVLVLSAAANSVASLSGMSTPVRLAFGVTAALCLLALVVDSARGRRRR